MEKSSRTAWRALVATIRHTSRRWKSADSTSTSLDSFGAWDSTTDLPLQVEESIASGKPIPDVGIKNVGVSSVKGRRSYNEDMHGVEQLNYYSKGRTNRVLYVGVFDGHGNDSCAKFCANVFPKHLSYWFNHESDVPAALHKSFLEVNNAFASWYTFNRKGPDYVMSGTTATICLLHNSVNLYIGHVGDSRAILCRSGEARKITTDHEPTLIVEKKRIEGSGGRISESGRVNDRLNMSRSIGDMELKKYGVIAVPDVISLKCDHSRDAFIVLSTDGVNGVMTDAEIVEIVKGSKDPQYAANLLTDTAYEYSSKDNNTAIVVPLGSWGKYSAAATIFHSFGKTFSSSSRFG